MANTRRASVLKKTQADTKYCVHLWNEWRVRCNSRASTDRENVPDITQMDCKTMQYWLSHFVLEVRKKNGSIYPANTSLLWSDAVS